MKVLQLTLLCLCAFLISSAFGAIKKKPPAKTCKINGEILKPGETCKIKCNICTCHPSGKVSCTRKLCPVICKYQGRIYQVGYAFYDKCNLCLCTESGRVDCTKKLCVIPVDCRWNPCVNGGKCERVSFGVYKCKCPTAVYGDYCEKDPCDPNPCKGSTSMCNSTGYGGFCCTDRCNPNPCLWYETCKPRKYDRYICTDSCKPNPCKFGKCYPLGNGKYKCQGCLYCGKVYRPQERFRIKCDVCNCHSNGIVTCTRKCGTCSHNGRFYRSGSVIRVKCNTCHCLNGEWACTRKQCLGVPFKG